MRTLLAMFRPLNRDNFVTIANKNTARMSRYRD
jgi:hypothetical protein